MKKNNNSKANKTTKFSNKHDVECIKSGEYDLSNFKERKLTSPELYFLKYITNIKSNRIGYIPTDWTYDYHLDFQDVLNQFVGQNLVDIEVMELSEKIGVIHTVKDLKEILKYHGLSVSGKKSDLIERVIEVYDKSLLQEYENDRYINYKMTEKGMRLTKHINPSISRDMELEDEIYHLVLNDNIEEAYKRVLDSKKLDYPIRLDKKISKYKNLSSLDLNLPVNIKNKQKNIIFCVIAAHIIGCYNHKIKELIKRVVDIDLGDKQIDNYVYYILDFIKLDKGRKSSGDNNKKEISTNPMDDMDNKLKELILQGKRMEAIKAYRIMTGHGLKEANIYIDDLN